MKSPMWIILIAVTLVGWATYFPAQGQQSPSGANAGTTNSGPTGAYPGSGSSITNAPSAPPGATPGGGSAGTTNSGPTGAYPGSGSSITNAPTVPPGTTPGQGSTGAAKTPPSGNYPGTGSGQQ